MHCKSFFIRFAFFFLFSYFAHFCSFLLVSFLSLSPLNSVSLQSLQNFYSLDYACHTYTNICRVWDCAIVFRLLCSSAKSLRFIISSVNKLYLYMVATEHYIVSVKSFLSGHYFLLYEILLPNVQYFHLIQLDTMDISDVCFFCVNISLFVIYLNIVCAAFWC